MGTMYFKVPVDSVTGKKFTEFVKQCDVAKKAVNEFSKKYGFESFRYSRFSVVGGLSSCVNFKKEPDPKVWKKLDTNEFFPRGNKAEGKLILEEINQLPRTTPKELNSIIGYDENPFNTIGFSFITNKKFYGFTVGEDWEFKKNKDHIEITCSEFNKLFKQK